MLFIALREFQLFFEANICFNFVPFSLTELTRFTIVFFCNYNVNMNTILYFTFKNTQHSGYENMC